MQLIVYCGTLRNKFVREKIIMVYLVVCIILILIVIGFIIKCFMAIGNIAKGAVQDYKSVKGSEKEEADRIIAPYVKNGKIASWAYKEVEKKLEQLENKSQLFIAGSYLDDLKLCVLELPEYFKATDTSKSGLTLNAVSRICEMDLDHYRMTGSLTDHDKKNLEYLVRMWYFSDPECNTIAEAGNIIQACFDKQVSLRANKV